MKKHMSKLKILTAAIAVIMTGSALTFAGTVAVLKAQSRVDNTITVANVDCKAVEDDCIKDSGDNVLLKKNVTIKNIGDISAYIRVAIVVNYVNASGEVKAIQPIKDTDYTLDINEDDWILGDDGYYYCKAPVMADECSPVLIEESRVKASVEGCHIDMTIISSAIQSKPASAVESVWPQIKVNGDQLQKR